MDPKRIFPLLTAFFFGSWLSNGHIIQTTTVLLQEASPTLILAASSLAGLGFFALLRLISSIGRPQVAGYFLMPGWLMLQFLPYYFPQYPLMSALSALLFGEVVKWHLYSQVFLRWGPMGASRMLGYAVLAYELGTIAASLFPVNILWLQFLAMIPLYVVFLVKKEESEPVITSAPKVDSSVNLWMWLVGMGVMAGFLRVSADTGFKFGVRLQGLNPKEMVSQYYLLSACFTLGLGVLQRMRWTSPRMGCPEASLKSMGWAQMLFAAAFLSANPIALVVVSAFQRSMDKIFYQPTMQVLTSGFAWGQQESLRRGHVAGFLGLGSLMGLVAFGLHRWLPSMDHVMVAIAVMHATVAVAMILSIPTLVQKVVMQLDGLTGSRAMAMLALLSPRLFLVHAWNWSNQRGGMQSLPPELLQGLIAEPGREVVLSFYSAYPGMEETHQLALIRLASFLDRGADREFLLQVAEEKIPSCVKARRLAAHQLVKVLGKEARPLLRRARGRKSPLKKAA